jgi:hypothetical protein
MTTEISFPNWDSYKAARSYAKLQNSVCRLPKDKKHVVLKGEILNLDWLRGDDDVRENEPKFISCYTVVLR